MILKCHTSFDTMADYNPATGSFAIFSRKAEPGRVPSQIAGLFDQLGGKLVLLFRLAGVLYLQVEGQRMPMTDGIIKLGSLNAHRVLRILSDSSVVLELSYDPPIIDPPLCQDPTAFVEEEHLDFGLFLANLSRDRNRQARMYAEA